MQGGHKDVARLQGHEERRDGVSLVVSVVSEWSCENAKELGDKERVIRGQESWRLVTVKDFNTL